jgi:hypothetical protein
VARFDRSGMLRLGRRILLAEDSPSVSAISDRPSRNLLITAIANGIIEDSRIGSSRRAHLVDARAGFVGVRGSVDC